MIVKVMSSEEQRMFIFQINDIGNEFDLSKIGHFRGMSTRWLGLIRNLNMLLVMILCFVKSLSILLRVLYLIWGPKVVSDHQKNIERNVRNDLEVIENSTSTNVVKMNSGASVGNKVKDSENLFVLDSDVCGSSHYDYLLAAYQFHNGSQKFNENGWDPSFTDRLMDLLNFDQKNGEIEYISKLKKRKFEEESFCGNKKMCLS